MKPGNLPMPNPDARYRKQVVMSKEACVALAHRAAD